MEYIAIVISLFLLYIGLNPVWHWTQTRDIEYLLKKETYIEWLYQSYFVKDRYDLECLLDDEDVFERYLKENKLPWGSELNG